MSGMLVVNASAPKYNLGANKLADWLRSEGHAVKTWQGNPGLVVQGFDVVAFSVVFSWDAPRILQSALTAKAQGAEVWCGGPGMFALGNWWRDQTGLEIHKGLDARFDRQTGDYRMTFASRGCPVGCHFCIVPRLEGSEFTLDWDFRPAPILCDNNLSALPEDFQEHIIGRYILTGTPLTDANSGFEPRAFNEATYRRWKPILRGPWRFALDEMEELEDVRLMMGILKDEPAYKKQVYVLIGNEPIESCYERAVNVIRWGGQPYCQPFTPLNALDRHAYKIAHDWTRERLTDFQRYFNTHGWRSYSLRQYQHRQTGHSWPEGLALDFVADR